MATPPPPTPSQDALTRRAVLVVIWIGFLFVLGSLCLAAAYLADARQDGERVVTERPLAGALALVPYVLPLALLAIGAWLFRRMARPAVSGPAPAWRAVTRAFIVLLALYELNSVIGFVLFVARPAPAATFFTSAAASFLLLLVGLWQLVTTWPRE